MVRFKHEGRTNRHKHVCNLYHCCLCVRGILALGILASVLRRAQSLSKALSKAVLCVSIGSLFCWVLGV